MAEDPRPEGRHERRHAARRRNRRIIGFVATVALLGGVAFAVLGGGGDDTARAAAKPRAIATTTTTAPGFTPFVIATTTRGDLTAYAEPVEGSASVATLSALTEYGLPRTLLVTDQQPGWVHALLPMRPTGSTGWVRTTDVTLGSTNYEIKISLSQHHLVLLDSGQPVVETAIAIGKSKTPTTVGTFYVTDPLDLSAEPNGATIHA